MTEAKREIPIINAAVLDRLTPAGLGAAPDKSYFSVGIYPNAIVDAMRTIADGTDDYSITIVGEPGNLVYTGVHVSVDRSGDRKDHRGNVYFYYTSSGFEHKIVTVPAGKLCVELSSPVNSGAGDFWKQVNSHR